MLDVSEIAEPTEVKIQGVEIAEPTEVKIQGVVTAVSPMKNSKNCIFDGKITLCSTVPRGCGTCLR